MALTDSSATGDVATTETTLVTGNTNGTLIKKGMLQILNDSVSTTSNLQVGVKKTSGTRKNLFNVDLAPGDYWYNDIDIILVDGTDSLAAIAGDASVFTYTISYFDDFLS
jgi:hypothetical protein